MQRPKTGDDALLPATDATNAADSSGATMSTDSPPPTVTIHVDEREAHNHTNNNNDAENAAVPVSEKEKENGNSGGMVELQPVSAARNDKEASTTNIEMQAGAPDAADAASPEAGLFGDESSFPLAVSELQKLFDTETTPQDVQDLVASWGGIPGLMQQLKTEPSGLDAEMCAARSQSVVERIAAYGENSLPVAIPKTFLEFCAEVLEDTMLRILMVAGAVSIVLGVIEDQEAGWYEGVAIWCAIILVTVVSAANNWQQQRQFAAVDISKELDPVTVIRSGRQFSVDPTEILVGDLVILAAGQRIPADGLLIQLKGKELKVNESSATGETGLVDKRPGTAPLLMSGTEVVSGSCVMLVTTVGINTSYGQTLASLVEEDRATPLQRKLGKVAALIGVMGTSFAGATFVALFIYWLVDVLPGAPSTEEWSDLLDIAVVCISIIVVAVPEGLPLAVTVSLAYSMKAMLKDNILVRELSACETMGNATAICSDKTGTLTQNRMTVQRVFLCQQSNERPPVKEDVPSNVMSLLEHAIILNSAAWIEEEHVQPAVHPSDWHWKDGNQTEIALIAWLIGYGMDVNASRQRHASIIRASEPFDSVKKYSSIIVERSDEEVARDGGKKFRQFFKGAAEAVIAQSDRVVGKDGKPASMPNLHREMNDNVSEFSRRGLRVIGFSYRDLDAMPKKRDDNEKGDIEVLSAEGEAASPPAAQEPAEETITDAVLIGLAGLSDPLRPTSYRSVRLCQRAGIIVRMVTGDHVETARFISRECGIWTSKNHLCMTGAEFRKMMAEADIETKRLQVARLRVLARSSPQDKQILVKFLQEEGEIVAATGDGTNDAPALKSADVGIAMFIAGTAVCKSAADLWLLDDNFASIVAAVVWGRCVFDNIRKFLAFQLTVNVVALFLSLVGAVTDYPLPLTTVQLLWINLIMDTAAAVALGTEQPIPEILLARAPKPVDVPLISRSMWYKIFSQSAYQLAVLFFLLYKCDALFPSMVENSIDHKTLIFNAFTWMQLGNSFNARRVLPSYWVFGRIFENAYFLGIMIAAMGMQVLMVEVFGSFANTTGQDGPRWAVALVVGVVSIPMGVLFTALWNFFLRFYPDFDKEDVAVHGDNAFEGANLHDHRYSFKRPDLGDEMSVMRHRAHSRLSFSRHQEADGPVAQALSAQGGSSSRLIGSMSARRAGSARRDSARRDTGSARRVNPGFQAVGEHSGAPLGLLDPTVAPRSAGPSREQIAASSSWPAQRVAAAAAEQPKKEDKAGVQVIGEEDLEELI